METAYSGRFSDFLRRHGTEGIMVLAANGKILSANRAAESLLGYGADQLTNLSITELWQGYNGISRDAADWSRPHDVDLRRRNGDALPASVTVTALGEAADGERLISFVGRPDEERLNESLRHAQRMAGIGTLTAGVAHELTNPISIITAACANLLDELNDDTLSREDLAQTLALIEQSAFRCARIVDMLRNYAPNPGDGDGADDAAIAITDPSAILGDALTMVEQQFRKQARVTVTTEIQPELTTLFCDHHRIAQVLINLLLNARDAMQPVGGHIHARFWIPKLDREPALAGHVRAEMGRATFDLFAFSVADTGPGVNPQDMSRLFEPFFTTKPQGQGTGLGLFIAKGIVAQHGGCIFADNNADGGATFTVVLPRKQ